MSSAFVIVDAQKIWTDSNPLTARRINEAARSLRQTMPVIWIYMSSRDESLPVLRASHGILSEVFNGLRGNYKPSFLPNQSDFVVTKQESNGFAGTNLDEFLARQDIKRLYFAGFLASQCVYSTAVNATLSGFDTNIVTDLTSDNKDKPPKYAVDTNPPRTFMPVGSPPKKMGLITSRDMGLNLA